MRLIFIHGSGGSKESFHFQTEYFKNADALDLPGHPEGELCSSINGYAEWLHGYIASQGYRDVVLAGHSLGGGICLAYSLKYPGELRGQVLIGSGLRLRVHPMFLESLEKAVAEPALIEEMTGPMYARIDPALAAVLKRRSMENGAAVMLNDMRACDAFDVMERAKEITTPTLAICGSEDAMTPPKYSRFIEENIPGARFILVESGTHFVFAEKPDEVNRAIAEFLAGL